MPTIDQLRKKIERIDTDIIRSLAERQELSKQIGQLKLEEGKEVVDHSQEKKLFEFHKKLSGRYHLEYELVKQLFNIIISYSRMVQK